MDFSGISVYHDSSNLVNLKLNRASDYTTLSVDDSSLKNYITNYVSYVTDSVSSEMSISKNCIEGLSERLNTNDAYIQTLMDEVKELKKIIARLSTRVTNLLAERQVEKLKEKDNETRD